MSDDELLKELARVAREQKQDGKLDERWDGLSAGTLSDEERAELERLAAQSPEGKEAHEAFRPLDAAARERISARLEQELAPARPQAPAERREAKVLPFRRRGWQVASGAAVAAAAAVAAFVLLPAQKGPPLPGYSLSLAGIQELRSDGAEAEVARLEPGSQLVLVLRPEQAVGGRVEVRAFLFRDGEGRAWTPPMEVSEDGAVRIRGRVEELLPLSPGEWTLAVAVGRPGEVPDEPREVEPFVRGAGTPAPTKWRLITRGFQLLGRP
jgi:hypothetical protein